MKSKMSKLRSKCVYGSAWNTRKKRSEAIRRRTRTMDGLCIIKTNTPAFKRRTNGAIICRRCSLFSTSMSFEMSVHYCRICSDLFLRRAGGFSIIAWLSAGTLQSWWSVVWIGGTGVLFAFLTFGLICLGGIFRDGCGQYYV